MATFLLLPGAGGAAFVWQRVAEILTRRGHEAVAVEFPASDPKAGIHAYADIATRAVDGRKDVIVVAQSMGGFTAPLVAERIAVSEVVFLNAMIPLPGETAGAWWDNVGSTEARVEAAERGGYATEFDLATYFLHDLSKDLTDELSKHGGDEARIAFTEPCAFEAWPAVPLHVLVGNEDRFFPAAFQERVAHERLGAAQVERVPGGHLAALSNPEPIADRLLEGLRRGPERRGRPRARRDRG